MKDLRNLKYSLGIDISMKDFCCCLSTIDEQQCVKIKASSKFANTLSGFKQFNSWASMHRKEAIPCIYVMEATGVYHEQLAWYLHRNGHTVSILLANKAKKFLQANGQYSKNDTIDARGLSRIGAEKKLDEWTPPSENLLVLRSYTRHHQSLNEMHSILNNQLHSILHSQYQNKEVIKQLKSNIKLVEKQLKEMNNAMAKLIMSDEVLHFHYKNISAIKGIGMTSFAVIVAETNGFSLFENANSLVRYAGYDVIENQSGSHTGRTKISKRGNSRIRRVLHLPAFTAVREDQPQFSDLYQRIYERTRVKMKGFVAVQKKLLIMMYYLWKRDEMYDPLFQSNRSKQTAHADFIHVELEENNFK